MLNSCGRDFKRFNFLWEDNFFEMSDERHFKVFVAEICNSETCTRFLCEDLWWNVRPTQFLCEFYQMQIKVFLIGDVHKICNLETDLCELLVSWK